MSTPAQAPDVRLGAAAAVRLVAGREIRTRLESKAYRIITGSLVLVVVAFAVVMGVIGSRQSVNHVGVTAEAATLGPAIKSVALTMPGSLTVARVGSEEAGRRRLADGSLDALVLGARDGRLRVLVDKQLDDGLRSTLTAAMGRTTLAREITSLGGDPAAVAAQVGRASVSVTAMEPPQHFAPERLAVGSVAGILIYLALISTGQSVAQGVVEEKSSRVVELLLAAIRPWQLMAGKVLGIGAVGLLQVAVVAIAGMIAGRLSGSLTLSLSASIGVVAWLAVWFVLGFTLYSLVFAALGALVSRQEDVGGVVAPAMMFLVVGYVVGISVLPNSPDSTIVAVMSMIPLFSPTLMPMRLAMGSVPVWQTIVSLALAVALIPVLVAVAGRIYRNGVVRSGPRVRLRDALRAE